MVAYKRRAILVDLLQYATKKCAHSSRVQWAQGKADESEYFVLQVAEKSIGVHGHSSPMIAHERGAVLADLLRHAACVVCIQQQIAVGAVESRQSRIVNGRAKHGRNFSNSATAERSPCQRPAVCNTGGVHMAAAFSDHIVCSKKYRTEQNKHVHIANDFNCSP